ncbi:MAG: hypothetical protein ATN35_00850 [Epulopiscium sp. Nele67-Bin004]|nr:MAG: hypothetical protein ATN35_00850 [Epulopiscium sp. Nele67-Bin004]
MNYGLLSNDDNFTIFEANNKMIRFKTSTKLEKYVDVLEWDNGYLVVIAKYQGLPEMEEYIDLLPILENLYIDAHTFLEPVEEVRIKNVGY